MGRDDDALLRALLSELRRRRRRPRLDERTVAVVLAVDEELRRLGIPPDAVDWPSLVDGALAREGGEGA